MGRRGWVSAEDAAGDWWRLSVFDDGWVELPGFARALSDTRAQLRRALALLAGFAVLFAASRLTQDASPVLSQVLSFASLAVLVVAGVDVVRSRARDRQQLRADGEQARAVGSRVRRRPGARVWRVVDSSAAFEESLEGVRRIAGEDVVDVDVVAPDRPTPEDPVVVTVRLHDGGQLVYRTPDRAAVRLFDPWRR